MSGIEDSFRDTISYMNDNISDAMRGIKSSLNSTVNGIPFPAIGLSIFTITVLGVMVANSDGNPGSSEDTQEDNVTEEETSPEIQEAVPVESSEMNDSFDMIEESPSEEPQSQEINENPNPNTNENANPDPNMNENANPNPNMNESSNTDENSNTNEKVQFNKEIIRKQCMLSKSFL